MSHVTFRADSSDRYRRRGSVRKIDVVKDLSINGIAAHPGDVLVFHDDGSVEVMTESEFSSKYEKQFSPTIPISVPVHPDTTKYPPSWPYIPNTPFWSSTRSTSAEDPPFTIRYENISGADTKFTNTHGR